VKDVRGGGSWEMGEREEAELAKIATELVKRWVSSLI
jgi:hypothetical protein